MKTIFINGRFLTKPITGVQRVAYELVKNLDELIAEQVIDGKEYTFYLIYSGEIVNPIQLTHIQIKKRGILKGNLWEQFELPLYTAGSLLLSLCTISTLFKRRQIVMVHDASFMANPQFFSRSFGAWYRFALPLLGKISRHIITVSNFSKNELINLAGYKADKVSVIHNSADHILRFGEPMEDFKTKINTLKPYCLAVSSLGANKNFKGLTDALSKIDFTGYSMIIAGGVIGALKYTTVNENAVYLGYVSDEELKFLYSNAALFVFPSFYEGFGIPPLEAMILGCPVVSSDTSALPEILDNSCEYFDPYSSFDIANKLSLTISNTGKLIDLKRRGYLQAAKYSWKTSAAQVFQLIKAYCE